MSAGKQVCIIASRLDHRAGSERAICDLANALQEHGFSITLLILDETNQIAYSIHSSIETVCFDFDLGLHKRGNSLTRKLRLVSNLRQLRVFFRIRKYYVVISTEYPFAVVANYAARSFTTRCYAWEHRSYSAVQKSGFWKWLSDKAYRNLNAVICLNPDEAIYFQELGSKTTIIPNFIEQTADSTPSNRNNILTVARLEPVKGIAALLTVARTILLNNPEWSWTLIGDGSLHTEVESFIHTNNLAGRLEWIAVTQTDLSGYYATAAIFVLTSESECFPMVLLEAMNASTTCIAFDCETGPRHIIIGGSDGYLIPVDDLNGMATQIDSLIANSSLRRKMSIRAKENVQRFDKAEVIPLWIDWLSTV